MCIEVAAAAVLCACRSGIPNIAYLIALGRLPILGGWFFGVGCRFQSKSFGERVAMPLCSYSISKTRLGFLILGFAGRFKTQTPVLEPGGQHRLS